MIPILTFIFVLLGATFAIWYSNKTRIAKWNTYANCVCGYRKHVLFGNRDHIFEKVCKGCGRPTSEWEIKTQRFIQGKWETLDEKSVLKPTSIRYNGEESSGLSE